MPLVSKYAYRSDTFGRRKDVVYTGSAFSGQSDHLVKWGYKDRSELTAADRHLGTDPENPGSGMTPGDYDYAYDPIGNRLSSNVGAVNPAKTYTTNPVNQYTATADTAESFIYDLDGNMTQDGTFDYTWDAENRLTSVISRIDLGTSNSAHETGDKKIEFKYDYMSRRVQKKVSHWYSGNWVLDTDHRFIYDQWNVVLVLEDDGDVLKQYTWGLDLSGQRGNATASGIHNAGGIGGLLACVEASGTHAGTYWFTYDANGNIGQIIKNDGSTYPTVAHYEYDPYGNTIVASDVDTSGYVNVNPFRFSTKWRDSETGLYYYGYRYYSQRLGRWLNRDPIAEAGGFNLYGSVINDPIDLVDPIGLDMIYPIWPPPRVPPPVRIDPPGINPPGPPGDGGGTDPPCTDPVLCRITPPIVTPVPSPVTCTITRVASWCLRCCSTVSGAVACTLIAPTPIGGPKCTSCGTASSMICPENCPRTKPKKPKKWRCTIKARNWPVNTPCYGQIFEGTGSSEEEASKNAREACYDAGCHNPSANPGGDCGHLKCRESPN